ncbi:toxin-antitoxin system YwqK family antitoxin [Spongiimicrobium sp. 3-5]|uniref:toxin-antitoxin system YwqK family antitoxin n=1 Tax=Spongiimicrobium sp. 3-5 TaxID=3332596 RepID=UPI003980433D
MKTITLFLALLFSFTIYAQNQQPSFEKEGDMVKATYFHEDGQIAQTGFYLNGKLQGEWKMYDTDGKKIAMGQYNQGKKTGKWFFWENKVLKEVDYTDNRVANVVSWENSKSVVVNK